MYYTVVQHYKDNANRHLERAIAYASAGFADRYFEDSMKKALRNFKVADEFKVPSFLEPFQKQMIAAIAKDILYGQSFYKISENAKSYR